MAANLTDREARELARDSTDGARVVSLKPNGPADQAKPALRPGRHHRRESKATPCDRVSRRRARDESGARHEGSREAARRVRAQPRADADGGREIGTLTVGRPAARRAQGVGAGRGAGADAAARRAARTQGQDRRARHAAARSGDAAAAGRHHSRDRRRSRPRDRRRPTTICLRRRFAGTRSAPRSSSRSTASGTEMPLPVTLRPDADAAARDEALRRIPFFEFRARDVAEADRRIRASRTRTACSSSPSPFAAGRRSGG